MVKDEWKTYGQKHLSEEWSAHRKSTKQIFARLISWCPGFGKCPRDDLNMNVRKSKVMKYNNSRKKGAIQSETEWSRD